MFRAIIIGLLLLSCASDGPKDDVTIEDKCTSIEARMLRAPWLERHNRRLFFLVESEGVDRIIRAVARNREEESILLWAQEYLARAYDEGILVRNDAFRLGPPLPSDIRTTRADVYFTIGLCGEWVEGEWEEFQAGVVDFEVVLLAVYDVWSGRYLQIRTNYGDRWTDAVKGVDWKRMLFELGKKGAKGLIP